MKKKPTPKSKRENPKAPATPRKRGVAKDNDRRLIFEVKSSGVKASAKKTLGVKSEGKSVFDKERIAKRMEDINNGVNVPWVVKKNLEGVGDFWRSRLPKEITVYGSGPAYRIPEYNNPSRKKRINWLQDSVAGLVSDNEELRMRVRGLEKVVCHLMDALKK